VKQGSKSVQAYYDELYSSFHRANVVDDMNAMTYFKRGLNPNIVAAIEGKYFRSMRGLLICAIKEEKELMKVQQDEITQCINLCQDICDKLQTYVISYSPMYTLLLERRSNHQLHARREDMLSQKFHQLILVLKEVNTNNATPRKILLSSKKIALCLKLIRKMMRCVMVLWIIMLHQLLRELLSQSVGYNLKL
jgi:hypothetical protein